jgi:hypothetical protein
MRRFSVRTLMVLIVVAAVGLAALRNANLYWAAATWTVVLLALATSITGALTLRGTEQYACVGYAIFSSLYLALTVSNVISGPQRSLLPTSLVLKRVHDAVEFYTESSKFPELLLAENGRTKLEEHIKSLQERPDGGGSQLDDAKQLLLEAEKRVKEEHAELAMGTRWYRWLPGAADNDHFFPIGHSLFTLVSGLVGSVVAKILYARRQRSDTQTP